MYLKLFNILLELIKQLILHALIRSKVFLHKKSVFNGTLDHINSIFVVFIDTQLLVDQVVGFPLLGCKFWGESKRDNHDWNDKVAPETGNDTYATPKVGGWVEISITYSRHGDDDAPHAIP